MKLPNVLIVDDEASLLLTFQKAFERLKDRYKLFTAENGKKAVEILEMHPIDICITDIRMPVMDGFELLVVMNSRFPTVPVIVMSAYGSKELVEKLESIGGMIRFLEKPIAIDRLIESIEEVLQQGAQSGSMTGISVASFLQLLEMEEKTALIEVQTTGKKGLFYFHEGELYDAVCGEKLGEEAAIEMILWDKVRIQFKRLPDKKILRRIQTEIMPLLMEAYRRKDEAQADSEVPEPQKSVPSTRNVDSLADFPLDEGLPEMDTAGPIPSETVSPSSFPPIQHYEKGIHELASEIRAAAYIGIVDADGIPLTEITAAPGSWQAFSAKAAELIQTAEHTAREIGPGTLQEIILQTETHWIVCRPVEASLRLVVASGKKAQLGAVRLALARCVEQMHAHRTATKPNPPITERE